MIIKDIFLYFAQFIPKDVLRDMFLMNNAPGYADLKKEVLALPDTRVISDIKCFIFGPDEESVRDRISSAPGLYLFIDYTAATSYIDSMDVKTDKMHIGITCAVPTPEDTDHPSLPLHQDKTLGSLKTIRDAMRADSAEDPAIEWLPMEASTVTPFMAKAMANSTGWLLEWNAKFINKM